LFRIIADFYKLRKDDYLLNFENVHYYNIEES
jgi:hypothetical protein